jgi:DnaK suppressor protein
MDDNQLAQIRNHLLQMRGEVLRDVRESFAASQDLGGDDVPDIGDMSVATYHRDVLLNLSETLRRKILEIDAALERLANGEYGLCARCEEEIPGRRLAVRPFSRYCVECKAEVEKYGE